MAIPENIEKLANDVRTKIYGKDVREALASGIEAAGETAEDARIKSEDTETRQTSLEKQFDDQIANMTLDDPSSAELVAARTNVNTGESYGTIGRRLDAEYADVTAQLAETSKLGALGKLNGQYVAAHRGFGYVFPENTVVAFENACKCGADIIETDIYYTTDNKFICSHNNDISTLTDGTGYITEQSSTDILSYRIVNGSNISLFPGLTLCTFDEMLTICKRYNKIAMPELKTDNATWTDQRIKGVIDLIIDFGMEEQVIIQCSDIETLNNIRKINKKVSLLYLGGTINQTVIDNVLNIGNACLGIAYNGVTSSNLALAHESSLKVAIWTINTYADFSQFHNMGADILMTDKYFKMGGLF